AGEGGGGVPGAGRGVAVGGRRGGGWGPGRAGAATADPALGDRSVRQDHRLGAGLGGGGGDGTHHRRQRERLAFGLHGGDAVENVGRVVHGVRSSPDAVRA